MKTLKGFIIISLFLSLGLSNSVAQTILAPGEIVIVEFNGNGTDGFSFMPLVNLTAGTIIHFTDYGWTGTAFNIAEDGNTTNGGNMITYTAPSAITAGTLIRQNSANIAGSTFTPTTGWSYNFNNSNFITSLNSGGTLNQSNEGILVFQGTPSAPVFIWAYHTGQWGQSNYLQNFWSNLPAPLSNGTNAVFLPNLTDGADLTVDDGYYSGPTTAATAAVWLTRVVNSANWTTSAISGTPPALLYPTSFTVTSSTVAPTVTGSTATSITTNGATLNGWVNANNASTVVTFEYGLTTAYGTSITANESPVTGSTATTVSKAIAGLTPNTTYHYRVKATNAGGTTNGTDQSFTTALSTGLDIASSNVLSLYPNPATNGFTIQAGEKASTVSIYGLSGNLMLQQAIVGKQYIDISFLPAGLYTVRTNGLVAKLIKK